MMVSRQELLKSIHPAMKLDRPFFMKVYGYEITWPGFAEAALSQLEEAGCSRAREYYDRFVSEYEKKHEEEMRKVAAWYLGHDLNGKKVKELRKQREAEQMKVGLRQKSDRELLTLLQKLKQNGA